MPRKPKMCLITYDKRCIVVLKRMKNMVKTNGQTDFAPLGKVISSALEESGMSINDLAMKLDITYEHARRIVSGSNAPGPYLLPLVCKVLSIDLGDARRIISSIKQNRIKKKYGEPLAEPQPIRDTPQKKTGMEPIARVWELLTPEQRQDVIAIAQSLARRGRHKNAV